MDHFFESSEHYKAFRAAWKAACHHPEIRLHARDYALYALLRGRSLNLQFPPVTNPVKLANGQSQSGTQERAVAELSWKRREDVLLPYAGTVSLEMLRAAIERYKASDNG